MPDPESDRLLSAFRSLSDSRDRVRPGLEQLEQRITARRRRIRRAITGGGAAVLALVIVLAVALTPGSGSQTRIATQPDPDAGITPTSQFCTVAAAIQKENATPLTSIPNPIDPGHQEPASDPATHRRSTPGLQPALDSMTAALLDDISRGPTTPTTLVPPEARLQWWARHSHVADSRSTSSEPRCRPHPRAATRRQPQRSPRQRSGCAGCKADRRSRVRGTLPRSSQRTGETAKRARAASRT